MTNNNQKQSKTNMKKTLNVVRYALVSLFSFLFIGSALADAPTPVAVWSDFNFLMSGDYTWTKAANATVNSDGSLTVGSDGGLSMTLTSGTIYTDKILTLVLDVEAPSFSSRSALLSLRTNSNDVSLSANGTTLGQCWNAGNIDQGSTTWTPTTRQTIALVYKGVTNADGRGTHTYIDGINKISTPGCMTGGGQLNNIYVGCRNGSNEIASGLKVHRIALFETNLTSDQIAAFKWPVPTYTFSNINCGVTSTGHGGYGLSSFIIPTSCGLPEGTELKIKSITLAQQTGANYPWNYGAEFITLNGVQSDSRNGGSQDLVSWSIGNKLEYKFSNEVIVKVGTSYPMGIVQGNGSNNSLRLRLFQTNDEANAYITQSADTAYRPAYEIVAEKVEPEVPFIEPDGTEDENGVAPYYWYQFNGNTTKASCATTDIPDMNTLGSEYVADRGGQEGKAIKVSTGIAKNVQSDPGRTCVASTNPSSVDPFTVSCTAKITPIADNKALLWCFGSNNDNILLVADTENKQIEVIQNNSYIKYEIGVEDITEAFHTYVVVGRGSSTVDFYIDGVKQTAVHGWYPNATKTAFGLASFGLVGGSVFSVSGIKGAIGSYIDDFRVYRGVALTDEQVAKVGKNMYSPGPTAATATISGEMDWSDIDWGDIEVDENTLVELTFEEDAVLTIDDEVVCKNIKVLGSSGATIKYVGIPIGVDLDCSTLQGGALAFDLSGMPTEDLVKYAVVGAPYSHWLVTGSISGTPTVSSPTAAGYTFTADKSDFGFRAIVATSSMMPGAVSINVEAASDSDLDGNTEFGLYPELGSEWGVVNSATAVTCKGVTFTPFASTDSFTTENGINNVGKTDSKRIMRGLAMDKTDNRTIGFDVTGVKNLVGEGGQCRVIVYMATDTANVYFAPVVINGVTYTGPTEGQNQLGYTIKNSTLGRWGASAGDHATHPVTEGVNAVVSDVIDVTDAAITIRATRQYGSLRTRASIAAVQIVKVGVVEQVATATLTPAFNDAWSEIEWDNGVAPSETIPAEITISNNANITMMGDIVAKGITFKGDGLLTISDPLYGSVSYNVGKIVSEVEIDVATASALNIDAGSNPITYSNSGTDEIAPSLATTGLITIGGPGVIAPTSMPYNNFTIAAGGKLKVDVSSAMTINGITGAGTFIKTGTAELTLNNKAGGYAVDGVTIQIDGGNIKLNNGVNGITTHGNNADAKVKDATFILGNSSNATPITQYGWYDFYGTTTFENANDKTLFGGGNFRAYEGFKLVKCGAGKLTFGTSYGSGDHIKDITVEAGKLHFNNLNLVDTTTLALDFSALDKTATPIDGDFTLAANTSYKLPSTLGENEAFTLCTGTLSGATSGRYVITVGEKTDDAELTFEGNTVRYAWLGSASATISEDTKLSDIIWEPAVTDPSMTKLMLTVANGAAIILDGTFDCASLDITGDAKFVADDSVYEDGCWEKVLFNSPITISGSISFGELKEGFYGAFTQAANSISLRAQNKEVISINIAGGSSGGTAGADSPSENLVTGDGFYGIAPTLGDSWNNINKQWTDGGKTIEIVGPNAYDGKDVIERPTMSLSATGKNTWQCGSIANPFLRGYLDDGNGVTVEVHGVPYTEYDVIVYATSDDASIALAPVTINGTQYTFKNGETTPGSDVWGVGQYATPEIGKNALRVNGCTGDTVTINAARIRSPRDGRATLCAVQVINKGDVVIKQDFSATISESTKFSEITWDEGEFVEGQLNDVTIAVADGEGEVEIEFDKPDMMLGKITITCARPIKFKATAALPNVGQFIVDDCTSYITYAWPVTELKTAANGVTYAGGAGTADAAAPINFAVNGGSMTLKDATFYIGTTFDLAGTQSTVNMENATVYANGDMGFGIGQASFNLSGTTKLTTERVVLSQGADNRTANLTLSDSAEIVVTGSTIADSNTSSIMFGHWNGPSTFTMGDNAKFTASDAQVLVGLTRNNQTININGGVFTAKGIKTSANASGTNALNLNGGELKLGEYGITSYNDARTIPVTVAGDAKITSTAAMPITQVITVNEGKTLTLDATAGAITMSGQVVNNGTIELKSGTINLGAKREFGAFKTDAGTTLAFTSSLAEDGKFSFKLAEGSVLPTVMLDGVTIENPTFENNTITFTYTPSVSGAACYYDWTFTNTVQTTGAKTIATSAYSKNQASLEGDLNTSYADQNEEGLYTSLYTSVRPWANLNWSSVGRPWTIALAGKMSEYPNTVFISLGGANKTFFFSTTDTPNEVRLVYGTNQNHCEEITVMSVPAASTLVHVYEITLSADGKDLTVYLDGLEWASSHKEEGFEMINGIQVSGWFQGNYFSSGYKRDGDSGQTDTDKVGRIKMLRVYNSILGPNAMAKLSEEFPYNPQYGAYSRTLDEEAETWSATEAWTDDEGESADIPVDGSVANLTVGVNSELTINAGEEIHQESLTIVGQNNEGQTLSIKAGEGEIINDGATIITTPVTIEYGAMTIAGGPTKINGNGSVTFDFSEYPIETVFSQGRLGLTGLCDAPEGDDKSTWPVKLIVPEDIKGRKMTLEYTDNNKYELIYGFERSEATTLYLTESATLLDTTLFATEESGEAWMPRLFADDEIVVPADITLTISTTALTIPLTAPINGEGTIAVTGATLTEAAPLFTVDEDWAGAVEFTNVTVTGADLNKYGNENTTVKLTGVVGYLKNGVEFEPEVILANNDLAGLELTDGSSYSTVIFSVVSGNGNFIGNKVGVLQKIAVIDASEHSGQVRMIGGMGITLGSNSGTVDSAKIAVADGATITFANQQWIAEGGVTFGETLTVIGEVGNFITMPEPATIPAITLVGAEGNYKLVYANGKLTVDYADVTFTVPAIAGATPSIAGYTIGEDGSVTVPYNTSVTLVYTADNGKLFNDGEGTLSVQLDNITDATTIATTIAAAIEGKSTADAVAKIGSTLYLTLADAFTAAAADAEIVLLADVKLDKCIAIGKKVTLNIGEFNVTPKGAFTQTSKDALFAVRYGGDFTVVGTTGSINSSTVSSIISAIKLTEKGETSDGTARAKLTVNANLTGYYYGICGNGTRGYTDVVVNGGTITALAPNTNVAIFNPQPNSTLVINGGTITGIDSAVEIRGGALTVNGGTLTALATDYDVVKSSSGNTTKGAAVAVAQHTTKGDIEVTIAGGTLTGERSVSVANPQENDTDNVEVELGEATYDGALAFDADGNATVTNNGAELDAPAGYIWDDNGKLVAKALPTATQDTTITVEGCDLAVKYTLGTAAVGYDDWNVDFEISSDVALAAEEFTLKGSNPLDGEPMVDFPPFALEADTPVKLLETFAPQFKITYAQLIERTGGTYTCAVVNNSEKQANVTVKIVLSKEGEDDIVVEGSTFKGTLAKDYGIVISDDGKDLAITGKGSADVAPTFTIKQKLSVEEAVIRDGVETVGKRFFKDFTKVRKVTVGKDVVAIGEKAFYKCMSLEKIVIENPNFDLTQLTEAVVYQLMLDDKGVPYIYPSIEVAGYTEMLEGKVNLTDPEWTPIGKVGTIPMQDTPYRFFRVVLTKEPAQSQN